MHLLSVLSTEHPQSKCPGNMWIYFIMIMIVIHRPHRLFFGCHHRAVCSFCAGSTLLLQALYQLYFDPDMEHKNVAQKWLTQAQASAQAWQFCWALLDPDKVCCCGSACQMSVLISSAAVKTTKTKLLPRPESIEIETRPRL